MLLSNAEAEKQRLFKEVFVMQGSATNAFLKYHRKFLFEQTRGLQKAQLGLSVRAAVRIKGGLGLWWMLEPLQGRWPVPPAAVAESLKSQVIQLPPLSLSSSNQSSANIWKPRFHVVRLKEDGRESERC